MHPTIEGLQVRIQLRPPGQRAFTVPGPVGGEPDSCPSSQYLLAILASTARGVNRGFADALPQAADPLACYSGDEFEVLIDVENGESCGFSSCGDEQVRD